MNKNYTLIQLKKVFCFAALLFVNCFVNGQVILRGEIAIPDSSPYLVTDYIYEEGTAITKLDSGCFAIGGEIVYSTTAIQTRTSEQIFICKVDSQFNLLWTDTFRCYGDYYPDHFVRNVFPTSDQSLVFDADILLYGYDSIEYDFRNTLNKQSQQGARIWTNAFQPSSMLYYAFTGSVNRNDTFLVSGFGYDTITGNVLPLLVGFNLNGDTLFMRDYSSYVNNVCYSEAKIFEDIEHNLYLTVRCNSSFKHYILKIDQEGSVLSVDSILLGSSNIDFLFITSNRFLAYGYHQSLTFFDSTYAVIDSFSFGQPPSLYKFLALQNGSIIALMDSYNSASIMPAGNYVVRFDTAGKFNGGLRYNQVPNEGDFLQAVTQINDSVFIGTGDAWNGNFLDYALVLKFSIQKLTTTITGSQNFLCSSDSVILSLPAGLIYKWSTGDTTQQITVNQPGDYFAVVVDGAGTLMFSDTAHIQVYPAPVVSLGNDTLICITESVLLDAGPGFTNYLWQDGSTAQTFNAASGVADTLNYSVQVTDTNGCMNTDSILVIFDLCSTVMNHSKDEDYIIYPNPASSSLVIRSEIQLQVGTYFKLIDLFGREVLSVPINGPDQQVDVSFLAKGVYQFRFTSTESELKSGKFVIE